MLRDCARRLLLVSVLLVLLLSTVCALAAEKTITLGTGGPAGLYYSSAGVIAELFNRDAKASDQRLEVLPTKGSTANINDVLAGNLAFGFAQSDKVCQASLGTDDWAGKGPQKKLRAVCALFPESVALVALAETNIDNCGQLVGKRVSLGPKGSGTLQNALLVLSANGIKLEDLGRVEYLSPEASAASLKAGKLDAFFFTAGHPNRLLTEVCQGKPRVEFLAIRNIHKILDNHPYYVNAWISPYDYRGVINKVDTPTFGVQAMVVTSADAPEELVYRMARAIGKHFDDFKDGHKVHKYLMIHKLPTSRCVPLHPGAARFYREIGLVR